MKKLSYFLLLTVAFILGCEKINTEDLAKDDAVNEGYSPEVIDSIIANYVLPDMLYASVTDEDEQDEGDPQTRTYVDGMKVLWQNGDAISFFAGNTHNARYTYLGEDGQSSVEMSKDSEMPGISGGSVLLKSHAVYPYNENITAVYEGGVDKINLTYPTTQKFAVNSFGKEANIMVAIGEHNTDENLHFRNACGYLVIKLFGTSTNGLPTKVKTITLSSVSGVDKIAGSAVVVANYNAGPVITMADNASTAVTLDCSNGGAGIALGADAEQATEFWFCLPPVTFTDGIKITVTDIYDNTYTKQTSKTVEITRNNIQPMAALEFVSNTPSATKLWYTRSDDQTTPLAFYDGKTNPFDATIKANGHYFDETAGMFVIEFDSPLTTIQQEAFRETNIATIAIPEGVTTIEKGAFRNTPLTEITIPGSVNNVGIDVFYECASLSRVTFLPSPTKTPLNIGYTIYGSDADGPFYYSPLTTINLNRDLVLTDDDGGAFTPNDWGEGLFANKHYDEEAYKNQGVTVTLGSQVDTLSDYMFYGLPMQTLTIPGTVRTIGNCVFDECEALTSLTYEPSPTGEALTHGYNDDSDDDGPFYASPLISVNLNREIDYTYSSSAGNASEGLFGNKTTLTSVTIGEQVRTLSPYMFAKAAIAELVIPGTLTTIQNDVFHGCTELATLTFEPSPSRTALTMGYDTNNESENLFQDNNKLATLNLNREINYTFAENDINSDSEGLFGGMSTLTSVTLGEQVETLHKYMFAGSGITDLVIPGTVNTIANDVFHNCNALTTLTFNPSPSETALTMGYDTYSEAENLFQDYCPLTTLNLNREINHTFAENDIDSYSEGLFGGMSTLTSVTLGDQVKTLHKYMFAGSGITSLNLNKVETIDDFALTGVGFTELTIPGTLTTIGNNVFDGCEVLTSLTFNPSPTNEALTLGYHVGSGLYDDGPFYDSPLTNIHLGREITYTGYASPILSPTSWDAGFFATKKAVDRVTVTISDNVKTISNYMFAHLNLHSITIPASVTSVGENAFIDCDALTSAIIGSSTLGINMFDDCDNLAAVTIDGTLDAINMDSFTGCSKLSTLNISGSLGSIGDGTFDGFNLTSLNISGHVGSIGASAFDDNDKMTSFTVTGSVGTIGQYAFNDCDMLATVNVTGTVGTVSSYAFSDCDAVTTLAIPATTVEAYAYEDMDGLLSATLYGTTVGSHVFYDCNSLQTLVIDGGVTSIGNNAFDQCNSLSSVTFESGSQDLRIGFQDNLLSDKGAFYDSPLTYIYLDRQLVDDNDDLNSWDEGIFASPNYNNDEFPVVTVTLGNNVKTITPWMFSGVRMQKVEIPNSVTYIGNMAFSYCYILTEVSCRNTTPPTLGEDVFLNDEDEHNNNLLIKIPYNNNIYDEYRSKWSQYYHCLMPTFDN